MELAKIRSRRRIDTDDDVREIKLTEDVSLMIGRIPDPARNATLYTLTLQSRAYVTDRMMYESPEDLTKRINDELWARLRRAVLDR